MPCLQNYIIIFMWFPIDVLYFMLPCLVSDVSVHNESNRRIINLSTFLVANTCFA